MSDTDAGDDARELRAWLDAERAAAAHWRRVALQREEQFAQLRHRPAVRVLLALERGLGPVGARAVRAGQRLRVVADRVVLGAGALRRVGRRPSPGRLVAAGPASAGAGEDDRARRVAVVVVGSGASAWPATGSPGVEIVRAAQPGEARGAFDRAVETSDPDVVAVVAVTSEPLDAGWLSRLAAAVRDPVVAAVPLVVHPRRPWRRATAHDGLVRVAGVGLRPQGDGVPVAEALAAGTMPHPDGAVTDVDAASGAAVVVERSAYEAAGGLSAADDLDTAVVELCARLRAQGGRVALVPGAVVVDHRPVQARRELARAVDPSAPGWAAAVARSGAVLRRVADPRAHPPLRLAVTVAALSPKVAPRWGDWHLAQALAASLRLGGREVRVQTADRADDLAGRVCDVHVVLRGLRPVRRTVGQGHVLWIVSHPETVDDDELDAADLVLVASPRFADHLRQRTATPVEVMLQATDHRRFQPRPVDPAHRHDVTVVAKTRDVLRPVVADALAAGLRPRIYGGGWRDLVDPALIVADHVDNEVLPTVYSSAGVVLNDHWATMRTWGFVSNRLFDVLACGTPVVSDPVEGLEELFEGAVRQYQTPSELRAQVEEVLADPAGARERAERGRKVVLANHTFDHRAQQLIDALRRHLGAGEPVGRS